MCLILVMVYGNCENYLMLVVITDDKLIITVGLYNLNGRASFSSQSLTGTLNKDQTRLTRTHVDK